MLEDVARKYGLLALLFALLFVICFSENGVADYIKLKRRIEALDVSITRLRNENIVLKSQVERLQNDDGYLEDVARKRFGFIREGEKVYRIEK
ncbi:MAG: septum formation initiator family protein [Syntrophorhabdales bacterium]|jgi:cell division protein FtsB